jgi:hypothetical protein
MTSKGRPRRDRCQAVRDLIMSAASELGIADHVSVRESAEAIEPLVAITFPSKSVQSRIRWNVLIDPRLLRSTLRAMATLAQRN